MNKWPLTCTPSFSNPCSTTYMCMFVLLVGLLGAAAGCGGGGGAARQQFIDLGTAQPGGAFFPVGSAIAEVLNEHRGENRWRVQAKGTDGSLENIRRLETGEFKLAMSNAAITYFARRGEASWNRSHDVLTVVTLAPNIAMFLTKAESGIRTIEDLRGRTIVIGPAAAGFEMFVRPILEEHGIQWNEVTIVNADQSQAVDMLGDGVVDAAFLGGAVPTPAVQQATNNWNIHLIPFDPEARQRLIDKYPFFAAAVIPQMSEREGRREATYRGMTEDFQGLDVGRMQLITHANVDEELVYQITRTIWENRADVAQKHRAGLAIERGAWKETGVPFHPGAIRFYREIGVWEESQ